LEIYNFTTSNSLYNTIRPHNTYFSRYPSTIRTEVSSANAFLFLSSLLSWLSTLQTKSLVKFQVAIILQTEVYPLRTLIPERSLCGHAVTITYPSLPTSLQRHGFVPLRTASKATCREPTSCCEHRACLQPCYNYVRPKHQDLEYNCSHPSV
jgi:hypothetical protein